MRSFKQAPVHPRDWNSFALAAVTALAWGMTGVLVRKLPHMHPAAITSARLLIALPAAAIPMYLLHPSADRLRNTLARPHSYILASLLAGYYFLATSAFQMAPVAEVALLLSTPPLFVIAIARVQGDVPPKATLWGVVLATVGIAVTLSPGLTSAGSVTGQRFLGDVLALCAAMLTALYAHVYQRLTRKGTCPDAGSVTLLTFLIGGAGTGLLAVAQQTAPAFMPSQSGILIFLALGIFSTALPTLGFAIVSNRLPAILTSTISLFIPIFSGYFAYLMLGEGITPLFVFGSILVLCGVATIICAPRLPGEPQR
ncbi:DMT family transporter [Pseudodesulfovibrio sp.]|uniref:DMT family transporter n=1 Tax=unclassified Pseudodesulfovibrio TaxID=2661612 RepID=UPI003B00FDA0